MSLGITQYRPKAAARILPPSPEPTRSNMQTMVSARPTYTLRARFCGALDWLCPWCGYINHCRVDRTGWRVRCKAKPCRRWFAYGLVVHSLGSLQHAGCRSLAPPDITFPVAELNLKYGHGAPVNRYVPGTDETEA